MDRRACDCTAVEQPAAYYRRAAAHQAIRRCTERLWESHREIIAGLEDQAEAEGDAWIRHLYCLPPDAALDPEQERLARMVAYGVRLPRLLRREVSARRLPGPTSDQLADLGPLDYIDIAMGMEE